MRWPDSISKCYSLFEALLSMRGRRGSVHWVGRSFVFSKPGFRDDVDIFKQVPSAVNY